MSVGKLFALMLAVAIAAYIVPGVQATVPGVIVLAIVLGVINTFIKPILTIITLPVTILTLGLFALVMNALLVWLAASLVPGVVIAGFLPALFSAIIVSLVHALLWPLHHA